MSRVFILYPIMNASIDTTRAQNFGDVAYIFDREDKRPSMFKHIEYGNAVLERLTALRFDPTVDYVCCVGSLVGMSVLLITLARTFSTLRVLLFDATKGEYVLRTFDDSFLVRGHDGCDEHSKTVGKVQAGS